VSHPGDLLSALLDGELSPGERSTVAVHLAQCARCRSELEEISAARGSLRGLPLLSPPPGLLPEPAPVPAVAAPSPWRRLRWALASAAAALALVAGLAAAADDPPAVLDPERLADLHTARMVADPGIVTLRGEGP
jgi:anti-sigma factor RsiW